MSQNVTIPERHYKQDLRCFIAVLLPTAAFAQGSDVRNVMAPMPGILRKQEIDSGEAPLWMTESARPVSRTESAQENHPAHVQIFKDGERRFDGRGFRVGEFSPKGLLISLDRRLILGERQLEAHERIHVTVSDMMNKLPDRPAARAIRCVELSGLQSCYSGRQARGRVSNLRDTGGSPLVGKSLYRFKCAD